MSDANQAAAKPTKQADPHADLIALKYPFTSPSGEQITHVKPPRRMYVRDQKEAQAVAGDDAVGLETALLALSIGLNPQDIDSMDLEDYNGLRARFFKLLGAHLTQ